MMRQVDLIIEAGAVLPMTGPTVIYDAMIAVADGRILYVGDAATGRAQFTAEKVIGDADSVVMPGLVDSHTHVGAHLFGTICDDENVITALYDLWFPMEDAYDEEIIHAGSCLGFWDAVRSGTTTLGDDLFFPEATARAAVRIGARALICDNIVEFTPKNAPKYNRSAKAYDLTYVRREAERHLQENIDFIQRWRGHDLVVPCLGPHAPDTLSTDMLREVGRAAESLDVKMLMHVAQSQAELGQVKKNGYDGSIYYLDKIGLLSPRLQAAHMAWLDDEEIRIAAASGMGMSYTPVIMMACHSFPKIDKLIASGIKMGMGTDCFSMDELEELRYGIYMANYVRGEDGFQLKAYELLRIATVGGAECLGLADRIGTVEVGKLADLVVLNFRNAQLLPNTNYFETIAYRAKSRDITYTIINGRIVYQDGKLQLANQDAIYDEGKRLSTEWLRRNRDILERNNVMKRIQPHFFGDDTGNKSLIGSR